MLALVGSVFVAALLGSVHCAGMCGSFACLASGGDQSRGPAALRSTAAYNLGRLVSYLTLGAIAGSAGAGLDRLGTVAGFARPAAVAAGILLMLWGVATFLVTLGVHVPSLAVPPALAQRVAGMVRAVQTRPPAIRGGVLGLLTAALPCGWLYAFVATAAAAGGTVGGMLVMAAFWMGTAPMMVAVGIGAQRLFGPARRHLPAVTALLLVVIGSLTVAGRFTPGRHLAMSHAAADAPTASTVPSNSHEHGRHP